MIKSFVRSSLLLAALSLVLGGCANTEAANPSPSTPVPTPSGNSSPVSSQPGSLSQVLAKAVAETTKSTARFDTKISVVKDKPALSVSSSYDWDSASGEATVNLPGGAISTAWSTFIGDSVYTKGGTDSPSWGKMQRSASYAHYIGRTPLNDPSLLIKWLGGAEVVSGDARSMVLRIPIPIATQYMEPSIRPKAVEAFQGLGGEGMEAIVDFDNADHIISMTFNIRGPDHVVYVSNVSKLSNFGAAVVHSPPSSSSPLSKVGGILLG